MTEHVSRAGVSIDAKLATFLEAEVLMPLGRDVDAFWQGFAALLEKFAPRNEALLLKREDLQSTIDSWHKERAGQPHDLTEYKAFLERIGYLVPEPDDFTIGTENVDPEIATMAGPQLVVPILNARFLLNAANARWGSLYDAFYGTDALDAPPAQPGGYDEDRGAAVIKRGREFLDQAVPLAAGSWADLADATQGIAIKDESQYVGKTEKGRLFVNNGLHIEVVFDGEHPVGKTDRIGIADIIVESALTTIADCEDSVAAVDAEDKLLAYSNWLGVIRGDLHESFEKGGRKLTRKLAGDKGYTAPDGSKHSLSGRSLLFVRNVGHLMTNPA
ncbi:MAG: malate synthase G, partial [Altererythrobacter sp.]|nr:malate synthase G [Altererythrobacter sp.]